jgi:hypothetical protein
MASKATPLQSGFINTGTNTPTGARMQYAVDNPYIEKDFYLTTPEAQGLGITCNSQLYTSGALDNMLLAASAWVNRFTGKYMDTQTIDETQRGFRVRPYNPQLVHIVPKNRPYSKMNSIYIQVLKWFIQVDTSPTTGYLQDFYDIGTARIVPLLSTAGTGAGSPIPAAILDKVSLGVLWINYTFGYGTPLVNNPMDKVGNNAKLYQSPVGNRLWAPSQTTQIYDNNVLVAASNYTVDYPAGAVTFVDSYAVGGPVTASFTTNESLPADLRQAVILLTSFLVGQAQSNPLGVDSYSIQTFSVNFGNDKSGVQKRAEQLLDAYATSKNMPRVIGA